MTKDSSMIIAEGLSCGHFWMIETISESLLQAFNSGVDAGADLANNYQHGDNSSINFHARQIATLIRNLKVTKP